MKRKSLSAGIVFFLILLVSATGTVQAKKWVITAQNFSFTPYNLTHVRARDTIQWVWAEGVHTTTSTTIPDGASPWDAPLTQDEPVFIFIPYYNGTYFYQCTEHAGMGMNGSFLVTGSTGLDEEPGANPLVVYPNPFRDVLNVSFSNRSIPVKSIRIYDASGKLIRSTDYPKSGFSPLRLTGLGNLPRGIWYVQVTDVLDRMVTRRIVHE